jgi:hypothetical protein
MNSVRSSTQLPSIKKSLDGEKGSEYYKKHHDKHHEKYRKRRKHLSRSVESRTKEIMKDELSPDKGVNMGEKDR